MFVVARIVGPNVLGTVAFGLAFVSIFLFISDLGLSSAHMKLISEGQDEANCIATFARLKLFLTGLFILVVLSVFFSQKYLFNVKFESKEHEYVIFIYLIIIAISQLLYIATSTFAAKTEQAKQDLPNFLQTLAYQILRVIVVLLGFRAIGLSLANLGAVLLVIPVYYLLFKNYKIGKFDKVLARKYLTISIPVFVVLIAQTVVYSTDRVILQYLTNSEEVGYYAAGFGISQFIRIIESSAGILFFPLFSKNIAENEFDSLNKSVNKYERFTLAFIFPAVIFIAICSDLVVSLSLGHKFIQTIPILSLITLSMFVSVINLPYINIISGKGLFRLSATIYVITAVIFVGFAFLFVSPSVLNMKGIGVAFSLLLTNIILGVVFMIYVRRKQTEVKILQGKYLLIYGVIFLLFGYFVYNFLIFGLVWKIVFSVLYFISYFLISYSLKIVKKDDWFMVLEITNIKKLLDYINSEIKFRK